MSVHAMSLFFALLSVVLFLGLVALAVDALTSADLGLVSAARPLATELGATIATTSTLGSLYMSEIAGFDPCRFCWYQRGFMYPAAILLIVAVFTKKAFLRWAAFLLSVAGLGVAIYHRIKQVTYDPLASHTGSCDPNNPCGAAYINEFGFITIPTMAAVGFLGVIAMVLLTVRSAEVSTNNNPPLTTTSRTA